MLERTLCETKVPLAIIEECLMQREKRLGIECVTTKSRRGFARSILHRKIISRISLHQQFLIYSVRIRTHSLSIHISKCMFFISVHSSQTKDDKVGRLAPPYSYCAFALC